MTVWLVRAGRHGEYEQKFLQENRVYLTWGHLSVDLSKLHDRGELLRVMTRTYPEAKLKTIHNNISQIWPFAHSMDEGDLVVLPSKMQPVIYIGEIGSEYHFDGKATDPFFHWRNVKWIGDAIPRQNFGQDLLYSFGAFMTICRITRNGAATRLEAMRASGWKPETLASIARADHVGGKPAELGRQRYRGRDV